MACPCIICIIIKVAWGLLESNHWKSVYSASMTETIFLKFMWLFKCAKYFRTLLTELKHIFSTEIFVFGILWFHLQIAWCMVSKIQPAQHLITVKNVYVCLYGIVMWEVILILAVKRLPLSCVSVLAGK